MKRIISLFLLISIFACTLASCSLLSSGEQSDDTKPTVTIVSFEKTKTEGLVDTYTLTFSDGTTADVKITNGKDGKDGINGVDGKDGADGLGVTVTKVEKTKSIGNVDVYTMFFSDGSSFSFNLSNGQKGEPGAPGASGKDGITITSIDKTASTPKGDVYTIFYSNGTSTNFIISPPADATLTDLACISEDQDGSLTFKFTYSDGTTSKFTLSGSGERSEALLAYDDACMRGYYSGTAAEWVLAAIDIMISRFLTESSVVTAKDMGLATKRILDDYNTYFTQTLSPSPNLSEDAILSSRSEGTGGGYIDKGDSNVIISTVLGQPSLSSSKTSLKANEKLTLLSENIVLNGKCISLSADIEGEFKNGSSVSVGTGENVKYGMFVTVTATEITVQYNNTDPVIKKYTHGLQIKDYLNIVIDISEASACIRIMTSSGLYEIKSISWNGRRGEVFAKATGQNVNNATIRWYAKSLSSKIWLFGDSYFNYASNARWTSYLKNAAYTDNCQFGFPGMGTADALKAFKWATELGYAPKYAVWCMGMNNGDTIGSSTVNSAWLEATTEFLAICSELGITPILATIPSTPTVFNENKNAWIKSSGYRYIDFARAVGARYDASKINDTNKTGYYWYDGMLSPDLVHPDTLGAKALYMQFLTDFPEITE